ncbi:hypothetical protein RRG08_043066 [Elysia crispata]|uniref:Uncharacterized protein n=1 Tax=Elysia crispata TaxID=231223 RepID=A0AAE1CP47_9GAST|nr:hypothetical protein RRG08_043066 [Elysia crispata]
MPTVPFSGGANPGLDDNHLMSGRPVGAQLDGTVNPAMVIFSVPAHFRNRDLPKRFRVLYDVSVADREHRSPTRSANRPCLSGSPGFHFWGKTVGRPTGVLIDLSSIAQPCVRYNTPTTNEVTRVVTQSLSSSRGYQPGSSKISSDELIIGMLRPGALLNYRDPRGSSDLRRPSCCMRDLRAPDQFAA